MFMASSLSDAIKRVTLGGCNEEDIKLISASVRSGVLTINRNDKSVDVDGELTDSEILTGNHNVTGNNNTIIYKVVAEDIHAALLDKLALDKALKVSPSDISDLVLKTRRMIETDIQDTCGTMRVLDMNQPIGLNDIYTDVNILEKISSKRRFEIDDFLHTFDPDSEDFDRYGLGTIKEKRVSGLDAVQRLPKLMVLGKPGAGKTTFLKYLAIQCICGKFQANKIPIFITLKQFSENIENDSITDFIERTFQQYGISQGEISSLLRYGRFFILFDGLDEVREEDSKRVIEEIIRFSKASFFSDLFKKELEAFIGVVTYYFNAYSEELHELNLVDLNSYMFPKSQIIKKIEKIIFPNTKKTKEGRDLLDRIEPILSRKFEELKTGIERQLKEKRLGKTVKAQMQKKFSDDLTVELKSVSLLHYFNSFRATYPKKNYSNSFVVTCRIAAREEKFEQFTEVEVADFSRAQIEKFAKKWFSGRPEKASKLFLENLAADSSIAELATNPLLLTLLCLVFQENFSFPTNRAELYKEGVSILLKKWDGERMIKRQQLYKNLSNQRKEDLLSQIALVTFQDKNYFLKQREIEYHISEYICNLPGAKTEPALLQVDSEAVLKTIESQHGLLIERAKGIYSFSHLTFQEYFSARKIVTDSNPIELEKNLKSLSSHIVEKRWREVFLLAVGMLPSADSLLQYMKTEIDRIAERDEPLRRFLLQVEERSINHKTKYTVEAVRAFYVGHVLTRETSCFLSLKEGFSRFNTYAQGKPFQPNFVRNLEKIESLLLNAYLNSREEKLDKINLYVAYSIDERLNPQILLNNLKDISSCVPRDRKQSRSFSHWWKASGKQWFQEFSLLTSVYWDIDRSLEVDEDLRKSVKLYYGASKLLLECLNGDCYVSRNVRQNLTSTLFLPSKEGSFHRRLRE